MNATEIKAALNDRAEEFAVWLFPAGRRHGSEWRVGSLSGEVGSSLGIRVSGPKVGVFKDFATDDGGDNLLELYAQARRVDFAQAMKECAQWLGVSVTSTTTAPRPTRSKRQELVLEPIPAMPNDVAKAWNEGVDFVQNESVASAQRLADFRGWPIEFARYLIDCACVSLPLERGERGIAFQVIAPEGRRGGMTTRPLGYHVRLKAKPGEKAGWRFLPNKAEHGYSIPPLPFIIGEFETARLLVITEGQWDAFTFALAADWLGSDCVWPQGVGLIGIRGVNGWKTFLDYYNRFWPKSANCLLIPDGDDAGEQWHDSDDSFASILAKLCRKVAVVSCGEFKDLNDLHRAIPVTPQHINALLKSHKMGLESEVVA